LTPICIKIENMCLVLLLNSDTWCADNRTAIASFSVESLLPCHSSLIYTYSGSLTTPICAQDVNWNIFAEPIYISSDEVSDVYLRKHAYALHLLFNSVVLIYMYSLFYLLYKTQLIFTYYNKGYTVN